MGMASQGQDVAWLVVLASHGRTPLCAAWQAPALWDAPTRPPPLLPGEPAVPPAPQQDPYRQQQGPVHYPAAQCQQVQQPSAPPYPG
jgi:hypothetical protein